MNNGNGFNTPASTPVMSPGVVASTTGPALLQTTPAIQGEFQPGSSVVGSEKLKERPIFVSLQEKKELVPGVKQARSRGSGNTHTYMVKFFLVDSKGQMHYAATGIDGGDSHYEYTNEPGFPHLQCHNKSEVKSWAESVIRDSQMKSGYHTDLVHDEVRPNSSILSLPKFVSYSETKNELPDGRHRICWYLLDDAGHNHLAIVGNEKETRDGHYIYHTENIFDKVVPLLAYNQEEVRRWLNWIIGPRTEPLSQVLRMRSKMKTRPKNRSSLLRSRARGRGRHSRGGGHMAGAFTGSGGVPKKGKGAWRMYDLDFDARSVTTTELKKWLEEEVRIREKKKGDALAYVEDRYPDSEKEILGRSYKTLEKVRDELSAGKELGHDMLVDGISALREISHVRPSLKLASDDTFLALLKNIMRMGPDVMKNAVREILHHWLSSLVAHTQVMFDPTYVQDPRPSMEEIMKSPEFDQVVTRVTHRALAAREDGMNSPFFSNSQEFEFATFTDTKSNEIRRLDKELEMSEGGRVEDKREPVESCATLQSAPSASLVEATNVMVDGDSAILPPFQQQMALEGIEY